MGALPETRLVDFEGSVLAVCEYGDPGGKPLFHLHGSPGSRYQRFFDETVYAGFRVVMFDRPGFGRSTRRHGRTVSDGAADIIAVANALGIGRFRVLGMSAGASYAFAVSALHPDRVIACTAVVPGAPRKAEADIDFYAGVAERQRENSLAARAGEAPYAARIEAQAKMWTAALAEGKLPFPVPPAAAPVAMQWMPEAWAQGIGGNVDDGLAATAPWGFELATIRVPTTIWSGDEDDTCPHAHGEWLARQIPGAVFVTFKGGHTGFFPRFREILEGLRRD